MSLLVRSGLIEGDEVLLAEAARSWETALDWISVPTCNQDGVLSFRCVVMACVVVMICLGQMRYYGPSSLEQITSKMLIIQ